MTPADRARLLNDRSAVSVVQAVGYPNPSQSHFRSMDIWNAASTAETLSEGWVGKALKQSAVPAFHLAKENESAPLALAGAGIEQLRSAQEQAIAAAAAGANPDGANAAGADAGGATSS